MSASFDPSVDSGGRRGSTMPNSSRRKSVMPARRQSVMPGKGRDSKEVRNSKDSRVRGKLRTSKDDAKWQVAEQWAPPRRLTDEELAAARKMFFDLDRDGSGSIDKDELGIMMRSLGQNPTDEELDALIFSVDDGDKDGQIQLREFLKLYTQGLDTKASANSGDVNDCFTSLGGDPASATSKVAANAVKEALLRDFDLDINPNDFFGSKEEVEKKDLESILLSEPTGGSSKKR